MILSNQTRPTVGGLYRKTLSTGRTDLCQVGGTTPAPIPFGPVWCPQSTPAQALGCINLHRNIVVYMYDNENKILSTQCPYGLIFNRTQVVEFALCATLCDLGDPCLRDPYSLPDRAQGRTGRGAERGCPVGFGCRHQRSRDRDNATCT